MESVEVLMENQLHRFPIRDSVQVELHHLFQRDWYLRGHGHVMEIMEEQV